MKYVRALGLFALLATCRDAGTGPLAVIAAVSLTPSHSTLPAPQSIQLVATPRDPSGKANARASVRWRSSDSTLASVSPTGLVSTHAPGFVTITATSGSASGISTLNILPAAATLTITPDTGMLLGGDSLVFHAAVYDSLGAALGGRPVQWSSSDTTVVRITPDGYAHGGAPGRANVIAKVEGAQGTATVRVWCSPFTHIEASPESAWVSVGELLGLTGSATDPNCSLAPYAIQWKSLDPELATVTQAGVVTAIGQGRARIVAVGAQFEDLGLADTVIVHIDPRVASVTVVPDSFTAQWFAWEFPQAVVRDSAGTVLQGHVVAWSSSNGTVAHFLHDSLLTSAVGTITIRAKVDGVTGTGTVTVDSTPAPSLVPSTIEVLTTTTVPVQIGNTFGQTVSLSSTDTTRFTVTPSDTVITGPTTVLVYGKAPGLAALQVASQGRMTLGRVRTYSLTVDRVTISPRPFMLRVGDTLRLNADVSYETSYPPPYPIFWTSADSSIASVDDSGVVTARQPGLTVLTATSGGVSDTATLRVPSRSAPQIVTLDTGPVVAGTSLTIQGANFSPIPDSNRVSVGGLPALVTSASASSLTVLIPPADSFPCRPSAPAPLRILVGNEAAETTAVLQVASRRTMASGDTLRLFGAALRCNEFPDGIYLGTFANTGTAPTSAVAFRVATTPVALRAGPPRFRGPAVATAPPTLDAARVLAWTREASRVDRRWLSLDHEFLRRAPPLRGAWSASASSASSVSANAPFRTIRVPIIDAAGVCVHYTAITARAAYVGQKVTVLEDINAPLAGTIDPLYAAIGARYDSVMVPVIEGNIGSPLAAGGSSQVLLVFSPAVNEFGAGAFVTACDLFPESTAPSSNESPVVYAAVPDTGSGFDAGLTKDVWWWLLPRLLMHESAHLALFAERLAQGLPPEDPWLEEGVASVTEELWARHIYGGTWQQNLGYRATLYCDVRPTFPECGGRPFAMFALFASLYDFDQGLESRSVLGPAGDDDFLFPGASWSFLRWAIDQYATREASFLMALVHDPSSNGVAALQLQTGSPFSAMLADWTMATGLDDSQLPDVPGRYAIPTWNMRDVFNGMYQDFYETFTQPYPLPVRSLYYGGISDLITLGGGGVSYWEPWIPGSSGSRFLTVYTPNSGPLPPTLTLVIFRE